MKKVLLLLCLVSFGCIYGQAKADKQLTSQLDSFFKGKYGSLEPGCQVLVAKKGVVVYDKSFGSANLELQVPMNSDRVFKLGSITKQFTAVAILQLMEQGKIRLQDPIGNYITELPAATQSITIENLLTHTSGIKDYLQIDYQQPFMERKDFSPKEVIDLFKTVPLEFEAGTKYKYSNSGYFLLGYIIEKVSGKSYASYINDHLLRPLALEQTYFDQGNRLIFNRADGYRKEGKEFKNADYWSMSIAYSAGELLSNTHDLFKWHQGLYTYKILKKESLDKAFTPFVLKDGTKVNYGYGFSIMDVNGIKSIGHGGSITGFVTNEMYYPQEDTFVCVLMNFENGEVEDLSLEVAALALGKQFQNEVKVEQALLEEYLGRYTLSTDKNRTIDIVQEKGRIWAKISGQRTLPLFFQSDTKFQFKNVFAAKCEFVRENGKVSKIVINQNGNYEWIKTK